MAKPTTTEPITLVCLIDGNPVAETFCVEISYTARVSMLKENITIQYPSLFPGIKSTKLQLWKVNKNEKDMKDFVSGEALSSARKICNIFEEALLEGDDVVHILIRGPEPQLQEVDRNISLETFVTIKLKEIMEQLDSLRDDKKETISISRISRTVYSSFLDEIGLQRRVMEIDVPPTEKRIYPFVWGDRKEDAHASEYMKWFTENVTIPSYATLYNASKDSNLLSSTSVSTKFNFKGTLDLAIVAAKYERCGYPSGGVFMGIEVKKNVEPRNDMQAVVELVLADIPSEYPVIMLLTDLGSIWRYFWFQMDTIASCQLDLPRGIAFFDLIANEFKSSTTSIPATLTSTSPHLPYQNRCKFRYAIERGNDVHETTTPSEGIENVLKRPKIDWMTILPESDVADMRHVFDVMSPREVVEWKSRKAVEFLMKTPALQSTVRGADWELMYI